MTMFSRFVFTSAMIAAALAAAPAHAKTWERPPALVITNEPLPPELRTKIYSKPARAPAISASQVSGKAFMKEKFSGETVVGRKIDDLRNELFSLQGDVSKYTEKLAGIQTAGQDQAAEYYSSVATINTQLQTGTTPGNPRLVERLDVARENLEMLSGNIAQLNDLGLEISGASSTAAYLLESARAAYTLSGAVEEDHVRLAQLEDSVNSTIVVIDRLLNNVNDDITRTIAYLNGERENLRILALAISTGDLFGKSLANRPFSSAHLVSFSPDAASAGYPGGGGMNYPANMSGGNMMGGGGVAGALPSGPRPLVKIRFDRQDVAYEQPVYMAVNEALARYPDARFELVAVHPSVGNSAEIAIQSTHARRNAERVLRSLTQMGLSLDRVDLSYTPSAEATTNEVHLYVR